MNKIDVEFVKNEAKENFLKGFNCTQSVVLAFKKYLDMPEDQLAKLASPFGGGICRLRETCGAFSGMMIVFGLICGYSGPETGEIKADLYTKGQELAEIFENENESISCKVFLNKTGKDSPVPSPRTSDFYKTRPCLKLIVSAAEILAKYLNEKI